MRIKEILDKWFLDLEMPAKRLLKEHALFYLESPVYKYLEQKMLRSCMNYILRQATIDNEVIFKKGMMQWQKDWRQEIVRMSLLTIPEKSDIINKEKK
ncbi:MAG: hypothetical protein CO099_10215 [Bdellovibrio sp. CG_4_9_14_3_um_filter_39_7]|nr:MAG: hypothetical protein CO099_10215 [Bdellovibrio sp. CG_4_9_14_3_um_filter_39_7]